MPGVETDSPRIKYLNTKVIETSPGTFDPRIECYDNGVRTYHKAWKAYLIGFKYKTAEQGAQFGTELHILLAEGTQVCDLGMVLKSGTARGFMRAMENLNLRQPVTFRPWSYLDEKSGKVKIGGFNLEQGGRQIAYKYIDTADGCNGMPLPQTMDDGAGNTDKNFGAQIVFLRNILDTVIAPAVYEIVEKGEFEQEDVSAIREIAPSLSGGKQLQAKNEAPAPTMAALDQGGAPQPPDPGPDPGPGPDPDDLPF